MRTLHFEVVTPDGLIGDGWKFACGKVITGKTFGHQVGNLRMPVCRECIEKLDECLDDAKTLFDNYPVQVIRMTEGEPIS